MEDEIIQNIHIRNTKKWTIGNTKTIIDWIARGNLNVLLLDTYLIRLRGILRLNTLWSLVISSVTSTISLTQFTVSDITQPTLSLSIKIIIFITSIITSLITGYIKVEKIQENIETLEHYKSEWLTFIYSLLSELQVGLEFRSEADKIINTKKKEFNNVNSKQYKIPEKIRRDVSKFLLRRTTVKNQITRNCSSRLRCSSCCYISDQDYDIEKLNIKLSLYHSINDDLKKELLDLMICYSDQINQIDFGKDNNSDLFTYEIIDNKYQNNDSVSIKMSNKSFIPSANVQKLSRSIAQPSFSLKKNKIDNLQQKSKDLKLDMEKLLENKDRIQTLINDMESNDTSSNEINLEIEKLKEELLHIENFKKSLELKIIQTDAILEDSIREIDNIT